MTKRDGLTVSNLHVTHEAEVTRLFMFIIYMITAHEMDFSLYLQTIGMIIVVCQAIVVLTSKLKIKLIIRQINAEEGVAEDGAHNHNR